MLIWLFLRPTCLATGRLSSVCATFPCSFGRMKLRVRFLPSLLLFILSLAARTVIRASGIADNSIAAFSSFSNSSWVKTLDRSLENINSGRQRLQFALHETLEISTLSASGHSGPVARALRYRRGYDAFSRLWYADEGPALSALIKTRFTSLILKCSSGRAAIKRSLRSCVKLASLSSPGAPSSADLSRCLGESRCLPGACSWQRTSRDFYPFFCGRWCLEFRSPLSGMFLAVGNSSWLVIARPTRRAARFKPPPSRAATDQLTSRFSLVLYKRTSCW